MSHPCNRGYGASLKTGIRAASSPWVAFYDADGQHRPDDLERMVRHLETHPSHMLVGERGRDSHRDGLRSFGKWVLGRTAEYLTRRRIPDVNSGLRVVRREVILPVLDLCSDGFSFSTTSTLALFDRGNDVDYFPITANKRVGKSSVRQLKDGTRAVFLMVRLVLPSNPLRVFVPVSACLLAAGALFELVWGIVPSPTQARLVPAAFVSTLAGIGVLFAGLAVDRVGALRERFAMRMRPRAESPCPEAPAASMRGGSGRSGGRG